MFNQSLQFYDIPSPIMAEWLESQYFTQKILRKKTHNSVYVNAFLTKFAPVQGYFSTLDTVCVYDNFKKPS
jgi:hypothetical protein